MGPVFLPDYQDVDLAFGDEFQTFLQSVVRRSRFKLVENREAMLLQEWIGLDEVLDDQAFILQLLLD